MHELSICQALIGQVEHLAREHAARRVTAITLAIGPLSGVEPDLVRHAYPLAAAGTVADGARLEIEAVPVRVRCRKCSAETAVATNRLLCGACNDWQVDVIAGEDLLLQRLEFEQVAEPVDRAGRQGTQENRTDVS